MAVFNEDFARKVTLLCYQKFETLPKSGKPVVDCEWTLLAAVVKHEINKDPLVVSLATGSKCIGKSKLSVQGDIINDSHAEVLARRGFLRYLYEQISLVEKNQSEIFIEDKGKQLKLRDGITFHLLTSQTPCGDASIFPCRHDNAKRSRESDGLDQDYTKRFKRDEIANFGDQLSPCDDNILDIHRTGAKCLPDSIKQDSKLPGTSYHTVGVVRTKPGRGDRTLSVSCSDKILRWNYVGIQGALLTFFIEPIYLSSIIVSCDTKLYSHDAMYRAVINRVAALNEIRPLRQPLLLHTHMEFRFSKSDKIARPAPCSIIWCNVSTSTNHEVCVEGRRLGWTKKYTSKCEPLLISKQSLLHSFKELTKSRFHDETYAQVKALATSYQEKWKQFKSILGEWTEKESNLLLFK